MHLLKPKKPLRLQPPIIPVIDVVFNLIIFFMLTPSVAAGDAFLTTNLPNDSGPNPGGYRPLPGIRVVLEDVGPDGARLEDGRNEYCSILAADQPLGSDFGALRNFLAGKRRQGLAPTTPIVLAPTPGCRHRWVVRAFDAAVGAGFTKIEFVVPYD
jgi:biopolymer transport protein ExbD